jgi:DNA polymerase
MVGEQPGDIEERRGEPFVGPAGKLLDRALEAAGIDRSQVWVTNSVLHFKFTQRAPGQRRIHQTPDAHEVAACKPWLEAQLNRLRPELVILLGATAAKSLLGPAFRVTRQRGTLVPGPPGSGAQLIATIRPSAVLRGDESQRDEMFSGLVADLRVAASALGNSSR